MFSNLSTISSVLSSSKKAFFIQRSKLLLATGVLTLGSLINLTVLSRSSLAQQTCQCVGYVQQRLGIYIPVGSAKDSVSALPNLGFQRISAPQAGAIVVMQPNFPGSDRTHGHIGIVESVNNGRISVRSANQSGGSLFREAGCSNVSVVPFATPVANNPNISFWVRGNGNQAAQPPNNQNNSQSSGVRAVNFSGTVMSSNGITLRTGTQLSARSNQTVSARQRLSFDGWTYGETVNDLSLGTPDARWYRIAGTTNWVPSAYINGNAPNSRPMP